MLIDLMNAHHNIIYTNVPLANVLPKPAPSMTIAPPFTTNTSASLISALAGIATLTQNANQIITVKAMEIQISAHPKIALQMKNAKLILSVYQINAVVLHASPILDASPAIIVYLENALVEHVYRINHV